jgi:hypothetical protein
VAFVVKNHEVTNTKETKMKSMNYQNMSPELNALSAAIIGLAIKVHSNLGRGLLESAYKGCLYHEISWLYGR